MKKILIALLVGGVVSGAVGAVYGLAMLQRIRTPYKGFAESERFVEIPSGAGAADIRRRLVEAGVVENVLDFRAALMWTGQARALKAGEYRFDRPLTVLQVIDKIARGEVYLRPITFPEGLTIREMSSIFEARHFGTASDFVNAAGHVEFIADLDPAATDLEGYLFPETYAVARGTSADALVEMMVRRFRETYASIAGTSTVPVRQVVTLASLVEKETARADERPLVAAVYTNRLQRKMAMQADPTVVYALVKAGKYDGNIRKRDLDVDSPYNTYRYPGLPPGPIASPGRASLQAALMPADVPYLYFVSRNDGSHAFADTLAKHNANVYEHQILFFRKQRQERQRRGF